MALDNRKITFTAPWQVELSEEKLADDGPLGGNEVLLKKHYTLISPGTELACLSGNESWFAMPGTPGYSAVSEIVRKGPDVEGFEIGDFVFHYGNHSALERTSVEGVFLKVPESIPLSWVPFARMATVAFTSIRVSNIELGDCVAVTGLGLIGNMASQLAGLQGAKVIGVDLSGQRREIAKLCGVNHVLDGTGDRLANEVMELTSGNGVSALIEATGVPQVAINGLPWIGKFGELILLGSPRGALDANVTEVLNYSHLFDRGCITFKGAHEWRYPVTPTPFNKHSLTRNSQVVFELMGQRRLNIEPLISHVLSPEDAPSAYEGLRFNKDDYQGILFKWC